MSQPLFVISNRLPVVVHTNDDGSITIGPASGGLVTALRPVLRAGGGAWAGWLGSDAEGAETRRLLDDVGQQLGCTMHAIHVEQSLVDKFYFGFSNQTLWPLFHDLLGHAHFEQDHWHAYVETNQRFAQQAADHIDDNHLVWVNDYQLIPAGQWLRRLKPRQTLSFFLHIPFPSPDIYARLPWREELLVALLAYDRVGFQTARDMRNFVACVRQFLPGIGVRSHRENPVIEAEGHLLHVGAYPISIDFDEFDGQARTPAVQEATRQIEAHYPNRQILLGVDRLDYTKGLLMKFRAFERALEKYPDLIRRVSLVQIVVPSRADIPEYANWKARMDQMVGEINGRFTTQGWIPLHYQYRSVSMTELLGHYRASQVCLVTPLKDGMNLVCKEYCAACVDDNGVLVLSEFAGAAQQLQSHALMVNPLHREQMADAIYRAFAMPIEERRARMRRLRGSVARHDVLEWVSEFLQRPFDRARAGRNRPTQAAPPPPQSA